MQPDRQLICLGDLGLRGGLGCEELFGFADQIETAGDADEVFLGDGAAAMQSLLLKWERLQFGRSAKQYAALGADVRYIADQAISARRKSPGNGSR
jgi:hypothetical protein